MRQPIGDCFFHVKKTNRVRQWGTADRPQICFRSGQAIGRWSLDASFLRHVMRDFPPKGRRLMVPPRARAVPSLMVKLYPHTQPPIALLSLIDCAHTRTCTHAPLMRAMPKSQRMFARRASVFCMIARSFRKVLPMGGTFAHWIFSRFKNNDPPMLRIAVATWQVCQSLLACLRQATAAIRERKTLPPTFLSRLRALWIVSMCIVMFKTSSRQEISTLQ